MNDQTPDDDPDVERVATALGAPPVAPLHVPRQALHYDTSGQPGLLLRLAGAVAHKTGQ